MNELGMELSKQQGNGVMAHATASREMEEVKGQIFMAQNFPRNQYQAEIRILEACKRLRLAETAIYQYPRGGQKVIGPSIRLAEVLAQNWGNISFGVKELERNDHESTAMAYAWDAETNTRTEKIFTVPHKRTTKKGTQMVTDERDIYELVANMGSRRLRACLLSVIPGDIVEAAMQQCNETLRNGGGEKPLKDRVGAMLTYLKEQFGVTQSQVEKRFGYKTDSFTEYDLVQTKNIINSIKDGMSKIEDWFDKDLPTKTDSSKSELAKELEPEKEEVKTDVKEQAVETDQGKLL
ncbi:TPA_asm: hypothetical protein GYP99_11690 [Listeria monocytogenes]|uniref:hypothetical protein n=1 Tax=Listeria monocytogenes TaxID=1639 RepID=UPI00107DC56E|nr:hypothetical protein [Listeria monocytogenes]EAA0298292.1 hypothetical protein [Listeria monocytogenes]EAC2458301.1 hypothetical protein [Listeria monocytogenes]EAC6189508.1 hypothetical protein [Listeria monocytogenes]EAC8559903.1 hypothetical protein [Listeria monocytogenes]EAE0931783.1 hypothetical protein [Listeria monocytogenes]